MPRRRISVFLLLGLVLAGSAAGDPANIVIEFAIHDEITARATRAMGVGPDVRGWQKRTLYIAGERTAEYTSGALPGPGGATVAMEKVYIETPTWSASFEPTSGVGSRAAFSPGHRRIPGGWFASSDAAGRLERGAVLSRLGRAKGMRTIAGQPCQLYRPDPTDAKVELCVANIAGRTVVLMSRWYERDTVWMEVATSVEIGPAIPAEKFMVPASVAERGAGR